MNKNQVFSQVAALVGTGHMESESVYAAALSMALARLCREVPLKKSFHLGHFPPRPIYRLTKYREVTPSSPLTVSAVGVASFLAEGFGEGTLTVLSKGQAVKKISLKGEFSHLVTAKELGEEAFCELTLLLGSDTHLVLKALSLFDRVVEKKACGEVVTYFAPDYAPDFLAFDGSIYKNREAIPDGEVLFRSDTLTLSAEARGVYEVGYYVACPSAEALSGEEAFCVKREVEHLVPLLTAYYVLLEDGNSLCEAYLTAYREGLEHYRQGIPCRDEAVGDLYGW